MSKPERNAPCPCGSGKKFKKCCMGSASLAVQVRNNTPVNEALPPALTNRLAALFNAGQYAEVERQAQLLVEQHRTSGFAWKLLGVSLQAQGKDALAALYTATKLLPNDAYAHYNLGNALQSARKPDDAVKSYRRALEIAPDFELAHNNLGNTFNDLGQPGNAVASLRRAVEIKPDFAVAHNNLGAALKALGQADAAVTSYRRALEISPDYPAAHNNLGVALKSLGRLEEAVASYRRALEIKPDVADVLNNLGDVLQELGQLDDAVGSYRRALEINPDLVTTHYNLGNALQYLGQLKDAVASYRRALKIDAAHTEAHFNLGLCLLELGAYLEGWQEFEYRWDVPEQKLGRPVTHLPQWIGQQHVTGDRLLVIEEQGLGDRLQFARYLPLAAERFGGGVSVVTCAPLHGIFERSFPNIEILDSLPADQSGWQWQCPLLSLPRAFGTTLETIPKQVPYLQTAPERQALWHTRIASLGLSDTTRKIGIVWKTGNFLKNAPKRSLNLQQLSPLLNLPDCAWFSLQKEPAPDKTAWVASGKLIDWAEEFMDFNDTAALAMNLDLIISVDTAMAHLAGGLGRPIWLFNRHVSEWRWMRGREDNPWYPTMRIFTQAAEGDWDEVIQRMAIALSGET